MPRWPTASRPALASGLFQLRRLDPPFGKYVVITRRAGRLPREPQLEVPARCARLPTVNRLPIDIANPEDIRRKLPQVRALYNAKHKEFDQLAAQLEGLKHLIESLTAIVGQPATSPAPPVPTPRVSANGKAPAREAAIEALRRAGQPMGPTALYRFMGESGMDVPANSNALGASLWTAARAGQIVKTGDGRYAMRPITDYSELADTSFSAPAGVHAQQNLQAHEAGQE